MFPMPNKYYPSFVLCTLQFNFVVSDDDGVWCDEAKNDASLIVFHKLEAVFLVLRFFAHFACSRSFEVGETKIMTTMKWQNTQLEVQPLFTTQHIRYFQCVTVIRDVYGEWAQTPVHKYILCSSIKKWK